MQAFVLRKTRNKILAAFLSSKHRGVKLITYRGLELAKSICAPNLEAIGSNAKFCEFISFYKITKIVRALWLAERRVCMRVCKHGCDANLFGFPRANHASTNLKKVLSWKTRQVYFIYPFPRRLKFEKIFRNMLGPFKFAWANILSEKNPYFGKRFLLLTQTRLKMICKAAKK